jgi:hypothetical protein
MIKIFVSNFSNGTDERSESMEKVDQPPKRGRGRPPRNPTTQTVNEKEVERYITIT